MLEVQNTCNYKEFPLGGTHWDIKYLTEKIYNNVMIDDNAVLILNLFQISSINTNLFQNITLNEERFP